MRKIIYVKYSNERDDRFKIKTVMEQDESGTRHVKKYALTEAAKTHIANIEQYEKNLMACAAGTKLIFNHCTPGDGYIDCEYVKGEPLSSILDRKITQKDEEGALELLREYYDQLRQMATEPFVITADFERVFGKAEFLREQKSCKVTDIDLIFSNILVDGDTWNVIDLEWTFDFPVPLNFLLYRAILFSGSRIREFAERLSILTTLGLNHHEQVQFLQMEQHFQNWVKGNELSLAEMEYFQERINILDANAEIDALCHRINSITQDLENSRQELASVLQSKSWKITKPLRSLTSRIRSK